MVLTRKAIFGDGWRRQAKHLAFAHTAVGIAAVTAANQSLGRTLQQDTSISQNLDPEYVPECESDKIRLTDELESTRAALTGLERQLARETTARRILDDRVATLVGLTVAAEKRSAELESMLGAARDELVRNGNEKRSLQASLDLLASENVRIAGCVAESNAAGAKARSQLEEVSAKLIAARGESGKLAAAVSAANDDRETEIHALNSRLEAASARAVAAEKLLVQARQSLLAKVEESSAADREIADARQALDAADKKFELLRNSFQDSLRVKERQVEELEKSHAKLFETTKSLLMAVETRDAALARAEGRIKLLAEWVAQCEAAANIAKRKRKIEKINAQFQSWRLEQALPKGKLQKVQVNATGPQVELADRNGNEAAHTEPAQLRSAEAFLASTITI
jgi:chromosome segregation ATPase